MTRETAANGRVIPRHELGICGEHRIRVGNERVTRRIDDPAPATRLACEWASIESS